MNTARAWRGRRARWGESRFKEDIVIVTAFRDLGSLNAEPLLRMYVFCPRTIAVVIAPSDSRHGMAMQYRPELLSGEEKGPEAPHIDKLTSPRYRPQFTLREASANHSRGRMTSAGDGESHLVPRCGYLTTFRALTVRQFCATWACWAGTYSSSVLDTGEQR